MEYADKAGTIFRAMPAARSALGRIILHKP